MPRAFAIYRDRAALTTIGNARSEPFATTVRVGGKPTLVLVQIFERRVLTYTASNPPEYQVEMSNVGQHYYQWRYNSPFPAMTDAPPPAALVPSPLTITNIAIGRHGTTADLSLTVPIPACLTLEFRTIAPGIPADWHPDPNIRRCTPTTSLFVHGGFDTGEVLEARGVARDITGATAYTNVVRLDTRMMTGTTATGP